MNHKMRVAFGVTVLAVFGTMAFLNFNKTVAPYVPFAEAKAAELAFPITRRLGSIPTARCSSSRCPTNRGT